MAPGGAPLAAPRCLEEAEAFVGRRFWKYFAASRAHFEGVVEGIDTAIEVEGGQVEEGLFFRIHYPADGDSEHIEWDELARLLAAAAKDTAGSKRKSTEQRGGPVPAAAAASPAAAAPGSKRRRRSAAAEQAAGGAHAWGAEGEPEDVAGGAPDGEAAGGPSPGRRKKAVAAPKRRRTRDDAKPDQARAAAAEEQQQAGAERGAEPGAGAAEAAERGADEDEAMREAEDDEEGAPLDPQQLEAMLQEAANELVSVRAQGLAGHLKAVAVQNFMCHGNFAMEFGTHVNVVSGSNGSGKSAVLQAMQCCLGVKAKQTGRGDNLAQLVRTGCHEAKVQVTLWNTNEDAFRHRDFGDWLTVERTIRLSASKAGAATSGVRLLNRNGGLVSNKRKDLDALLDHLNIDASNPLAVMTQDTSRNFLCSNVGDRKKFELFMAATNLDDMQAHLATAQRAVDEMKGHITAIRADDAKRDAEVKALRERLAKLAEMADLVEQRATYERAQQWAGVVERRAKRDLIRANLEGKAPQMLAKRRKMAEEVEAQLNLLRQQEETLAGEAAESRAMQESFTAEMRALGEQLKRARLAHRTTAKAAKAAEAALAGRQRELDAMLEAQKETNDERQNEFAARLAQFEVQKAAAQAELQAAQQRQAELEAEHSAALAATQKKQQEAAAIQQRQHGIGAALQSYGGELQRLREARGQKLALFGPHAALRALVDRNASRFARPPIGPLGAHLTLTDAAWAAAAEVVLGPHLEKWIVLRSLAGSLRMRPPSVLVASFDRAPYVVPPAKQLPAGWASMRSFVRVEHPSHAHIIDNKLMDLAHYELYVVDQDEARCKAAVYDRRAGEAVRSAVHVSGRHWLRMRRAVVARNYFQDKAHRIGASLEDSMRHLQQLIDDHQAQFQQVQQELVAAHAEAQALARHAEQAQRVARQALAARMQVQRKIVDLQERMPVLEGGGDDDGDVLAEQQRALREQLAEATRAHDRAQAEREQADVALHQAQQLQAAREKERDEVLTQMSGRTEALESLAAAKADWAAKKEKATKSIQDLERTMAQLTGDLATVEQQAEERRQAALQACSEEDGLAALEAARQLFTAYTTQQVRSKLAGSGQQMDEEQVAATAAAAVAEMTADAKAIEAYKKRADTLDRRIRSAEASAGGNADELQAQLAAAQATYDLLHPRVANMWHIYRVTAKAVQDRWAKYAELFDDVTITVSHKFMAYMYRRGHLGKVRVDRDRGELRLLVKVNVGGASDAGRKSKAVKDLKQLSGGERSFTTVAFVLALGEFTESPFRAMDEYDVFMDAVNRRIATQTLLEFAREKAHLQFVLLTPQLGARRARRRAPARGAAASSGGGGGGAPRAAPGGMPIVAAAVVGSANNPLFLRLYAPSDDEAKFHYMVHASLDAVEEKVLLRRNPGEVPEPYLGLLYPTEEYRVYGYITNSGVKLVLVLDAPPPRDEPLLRVFRALHALYVDASCNPLYTAGLPLTSAAFAEGVAAAQADERVLLLLLQAIARAADLGQLLRLAAAARPCWEMVAASADWLWQQQCDALGWRSGAGAAHQAPRAAAPPARAAAMPRRDRGAAVESPWFSYCCARMAARWRLRQLLRKYVPFLDAPSRLAMQPGAGIERLAAAERRLGGALPWSLWELHRFRSGQAAAASVAFADGCRLLELEELQPALLDAPAAPTLSPGGPVREAQLAALQAQLPGLALSPAPAGAGPAEAHVAAAAATSTPAVVFLADAAGSRAFAVAVDDGSVHVLRGFTQRRIAGSLSGFIQYLLT
ncbi:SMC6 [Scenedesmus sp. PABB004]|nr:SMC6 [Scenedesmus sp. PABB004]